MDMTSVVSQVYGTLWYLIPVALLAVIIKSRWFKGLVGEFLVNLSTSLMLNNKKYHLIKNVTLPIGIGTTQIDHIIVSVFGVFVVETKNMTGWIFGSPDQKIWTQIIYKHKNKFQNPLHQNYKHMKTLQSLLDLNDQQVHSVVVFVGGSTFKSVLPENVTYGDGYIRYIKTRKTPVLSEYQVSEIIESIKQGRLQPSFKTHRQHVKHVKTLIADKEQGETPYCPKCGASMIVREARKGKNIGNTFWGCTKYPRCRGIVQR